MQSETYNLSWNQFESCASKTFKELHGQTDFADVTLISDDLKQIQAHKVILSSCSSKFKNILKQSPKQDPIIYMTGVSSIEMQAMINFMYLGETEVGESDLEHFLEIAAKFDIQGLVCYNRNNDAQAKQEEMRHSTFSDTYHDDQKAMLQTAFSESYRDYQKEMEGIKTESNVDFQGGNVPAEQNPVVLRPIENFFYCDKCDYKTEHAHHMKRHKTSVHEGVKYACNECDSKFSFPHGLERHRKSKHSKQLC